MLCSFWRNKSVLVTGHTGFKGGWLALWLAEMGARVYGFALEPPLKPNFFDSTKLSEHLTGSTFGDIRDLEELGKFMKQVRPEVIFHMAAQPLVKDSFSDPVNTYTTNVIGTVNVLEASRRSSSVRSIVNITTDKCYENREWIWPYREIDPVGGYDPYSSSKACSEIVSAAYRRSFLADSNIQLASARAGNVIGGGDWSANRLVPDYFRALESNEVMSIRNPDAVRPWQHVLDPIAGYLILAERLFSGSPDFASAFNFGPDYQDSSSVASVVSRLCEKTAGTVNWERDGSTHSHEAQILRLDSSKAKIGLGWAPRWSLDAALDKTVAWYLAWKDHQPMAAFSVDQIRDYQNS